MHIESEFEHGSPIPIRYTGEGKDVSPPLKFIAVPPQTKSLALIVDDPDAPHGTFDHWIVWNISPTTISLSEGSPELKDAREGINGFGKLQYGGPMPPPGKPHRYYFKLYALNTLLELPAGSTKSQLEEAIKGHIIDEAELMGTYAR